MANEKNDTPREVEIDSTGDFWKDLAELKKRVPSLGNKKHLGDERSIKIKWWWLDNGKLEVEFEIPEERIEDLAALVAGERESNFRAVPPEPDRVKRALLGEFEPLIRRFECGSELTEKERHTLAKIARGMLPRIGRPPESETELRNHAIVRFAKILRRYGGKRVADVTAKKFNIERSYVHKLEKKYPNAAATAYLMSCLLRALGADTQTASKAMLVAAGINEDDVREASGRKKVRK